MRTALGRNKIKISLRSPAGNTRYLGLFGAMLLLVAAAMPAFAEGPAAKIGNGATDAGHPMVGPLDYLVAPADVQDEIIKIGGAASAPESGYPMVGEVNYAGWCTGTLITPRTVLTAAHCIDLFPPAGCRDRTFSGVVFFIGGLQYSGTARLHPCYDKLNHDVAVVNLTTAVPGIAPATVRTDPNWYTNSSEAKAVGYGQNCRYTGPSCAYTVIADRGQKRSSSQPIVNNHSTFGETLVWYSNLEFGGTPTTNEVNLCSADSGGPYFGRNDTCVGGVHVRGLHTEYVPAYGVCGSSNVELTTAAYFNAILSLITPPSGQKLDTSYNSSTGCASLSFSSGGGTTPPPGTVGATEPTTAAVAATVAAFVAVTAAVLL
jgi:hypothetical protein